MNKETPALAGPREDRGNGQSRPESARERQQRMFREFRRELWSKSFRDRVASALPRHMRTSQFLDRFCESIFVACRDNSKLLTDCDRGSLFHAAVRVAKRGLTVGNNMAWLVPYKGQVQDQIGYAGALMLVRRSGLVRKVCAYPVYENDVCKIRLGTDPCVEHEPSMEVRGAFLGAYAVAWIESEIEVEWMPKEVVDHIRSKSPGRNSDAWQSWYDEMARAKVLKRLCKRLPIGDDVASDLKDADDTVIEGQARHVDPAEFESSMQQQEPMDESRQLEHSDEQPINTTAPEEDREAEPAREEAEETTADNGDRVQASGLFKGV